MPIIEGDLMGEAWVAAQPASDPVCYGSAKLTPTGKFSARSLQTFSLVYTAGQFGLDDTGSIKIVHRYSNDWGYLQTDDPCGYNYVSACASNGSHLRLFYQDGGEQRPWYRSLRVMVVGDGLYEGDTITVTFGDRSFGSPGLKLQSFCEGAFEFKVLADVCATGHFLPIVNSPSISIVPGTPALWKAVLPSLRRPGEPFRLGIKAEDSWGNPSDQAKQEFEIKCTMQVRGLPNRLSYPINVRAKVIDNLQVEEEGIIRITLYSENGTLITESNPLLICDTEVAGYWGDMHGQSGETVGINTAQEYFDFARNLSFLDATSHQANDFQINNKFWKLINKLTKKYHEDHRFVTYPGYEWSGNTAVGGDRNVYFKSEGMQIHRSSHALLPDRDDIATDATTASKLFEDLQKEDCVVYAHVGGRYADIEQAHDPQLETAMEIHSAWGTFEWLLTDGFKLGHRSGVVCNSDGHKGRPGASHPGAGSLSAYGGLTCFLAKELTRDGLFACLRRRHHYGTSGNRLHLDVKAQFNSRSILFERDPRYFGINGKQTNEAIMGDIVQTNDTTVKIIVNCIAQTPIERIDILNGTKVIETIRGYEPNDLGNRIRIIWQGAEYRGRGRQTTWQGQVELTQGNIRKMTPINAWNPERPTELKTNSLIAFDTVTTGNFRGFDAWIDETATSMIKITTNHVCGDFILSNIGFEDTLLDAGGLERKIKIYRLPSHNIARKINKSIELPLMPKGDNPIWVRVTTVDGFNAWSSPIFIYNSHSDPLLQ